MDIITIVVNVAFGIACAAVPVYFGYKNKLYHFAVIGAILCIAVIFFPHGMVLSALCAGLFFFMIKKELKTRAEMEKRQKVKEAERKLLENDGDIQEKSIPSFNRSEIWPPVLIDSLNGDDDKASVDDADEEIEE